MGLNLGPAVGARGQCGFAEEGIWGKSISTPTNFVEILNESIISEIGSLVSNSLRPDRAVHKRIGGVEACGGDIGAELGPSGFETWFKHALGSVATTRIDTAFVIECTNPNETGAVLTITHTSGEATALTVEFTVESGDDLTLDLTSGSYDTLGEVMTAINANPYLAAWSPYQLTQGVYQSTLHASDYNASTANSNILEETANIDLIKTGSIGNRRWVVGTSWGIYSHVIDAASSLPPGVSMEIGRDVAAFLYRGMKVNTMEVSITPNEILTGTFGWMGSGGSTAGDPSANSSNTGHERDAFKIRYTGEQSTATLTIDATNKNMTIAVDGTTDDIVLNLSDPLVDPDTGIVYNVDKIGGLVSYLDSQSFIDCEMSDYASQQDLSTYLKTASAVDITGTSFISFPFTLADSPAVPIIWGDYIGSDEGDADTFYVKVSGAGVPGVATLQFKKNDGAYGNEVTTSATVPSTIKTGNAVDSGFTIFFPDAAALVLNDVWSFKTIRTPASTSYSSIDPFSGFEGSLTIGGTAQDIMGASITLNNNLYGDKYHLGSRQRAKLPEQRRSVEGTFTTEFDNLDLYRQFVNGTNSNVVITFTHNDYISDSVIGDSATKYSLAIRLPNIEYNGETPTISDEGIIQTDMPFVSLYDDTNDIPDYRITLVSDTAYI